MQILFITSKDHWVHGWFTSPNALQIGVDVLREAGIEVIREEVENTSQLENVLEHVSADTLIWSNAYFINGENDEPVWLQEYLEQRHLPFIGSTTQTISIITNKDVCQKKLQETQIPIPEFIVISRENVSEFNNLISKADFNFPVVLKPTTESGSIGVCLAKNQQETERLALEILKDFPQSNVIIEAFLPSDDITCGYLQLGERFMLLPTFYIVKSVSSKTNILGRKERLRSWDGTDKIQPPVLDKNILNQLKAIIPQTVNTLNVRGITRIDGRLDKDGILRLFDVNCLPALAYPDGVLVKQCFACFPNYSQMEVYSGLLHTIIYQALLNYNMNVPKALQNHNLFTMKSDLILRDKIPTPTHLTEEMILSRITWGI